MARQRGKGTPVRVRTKRMPDGTLLRVYVYDTKSNKKGGAADQKMQVKEQCKTIPMKPRAKRTPVKGK